VTNPAPSPPIEPALFLVVGGDDGLALGVCGELAPYPFNRLRVLWNPDERLAAAVRRVGVEFVAGVVYEDEMLRSAGVEKADVLLALSQDDRLNLQVALKARDLNPKIRLVLRIFNRRLGRKIHENLANCSVVSLAAHSAATYATAAVDAHAFYGMPFPDDGGALLGFSEAGARRRGYVGSSVADVQRNHGTRIISVDGVLIRTPSEVPFKGSASVVSVGPVRRDSEPVRVVAPSALVQIQRFFAMLRRAYLQIDPVAKSLILTALFLLFFGTYAFVFSVNLDPWTAFYLVIETMTTTGFGDIPPHQYGPITELIAVVLMISGILFSGMFIATVSSSLTRARWDSIQGLRQIYRRGHIIVCGAGQVGSRVIEYLRGLGHQIVVIERNPKREIIELSRNREIDLITADASDEAVLDLCNLESARALVVLTESDTMNLEVALGARARNPSLHIVMRIGESSFGRSIARNFHLATTFSAAELAAPTFGGYARTPNFLGRVHFDGVNYGLIEFQEPKRPVAIRRYDSLPLFVHRAGNFHPIFDYDEVHDGDYVLAIVPMAQFSTPEFLAGVVTDTQ
jgi:Trk K+ transport system NAD-binding subunit